MSILKVSGLNLTIDSAHIINNASLEIETGQIIGLIGPNGAGKSMLLKSILGLNEEAQGVVTIDDQDINTISLKAKAKFISYAAQGAPVHWPLAVGHLVSLGRIPHLSPWQTTTEEDQQLTLNAMKMTEVDHLSMRTTTSLSGGERARAMLARAIVTGSDFLFADEPIEALDPYHQIQIMDILKNLAKKGKGVLVVIHDLNVAQQYCDQLILMDKGKIIKKDIPINVLTDEILRETYNIKATRLKTNDQNIIVPTSLAD